MPKKLLLLIGVSILFAGAAFAQGDSTKSSAAATMATSESKPARFTPNKDQIMQGQKLLKEGKMYTGEATGVYNDDTRAAIRKYQKDNGLTISGNFNRATLEKMNIALTDKQKGIATTTSSSSSSSKAKTTSGGPSTTASSDAPKRPAPFRANAAQIKAAQKTLRDGKMYTGEETGKLDDATRDGLKKYQEANKLKATGGLNAVTLEKMGITLTDAQKANVAAQAAYDAAKKN